MPQGWEEDIWRFFQCHMTKRVGAMFIWSINPYHLSRIICRCSYSISFLPFISYVHRLSGSIYFNQRLTRHLAFPSFLITVTRPILSPQDAIPLSYLIRRCTRRFYCLHRLSQGFPATCTCEAHNAFFIISDSDREPYLKAPSSGPQAQRLKNHGRCI